MIRRNQLLAGVAAGLVSGGLAAGVTRPDYGWVVHLVVATLLGGLFGVGFGARLRSAGAALMWGQAFGLVWWLVGPLSAMPVLFGDGLRWTLGDIQADFASLPANIVIFGGILGLGTYALGMIWPLADFSGETAGPAASEPIPPLARAVVVGGISGLFGARVFLIGVEAAEFLPLVATIVGMNAKLAGGLLHYLIGVIIAVVFALLFYREVSRPGPALIWGMSYGVLWWVIGPLTLLPLLTGSPVEWSIEAGQANFAALVAHLLYGALVGFIFALINGVWAALFVDSDPLNRTREGRGASGVRGLLMGQAGGVLGGLLFTFVMAGIGALPDVAGLVGSRSAAVGLFVHLIIAVTIGSSYGVLFNRSAVTFGTALGWGVLYGVLWWLLGPLTLFPALLRQPVDWSLTAAAANYAPLIGHLLYGLGLGLFFQYLARRYDPFLASRKTVTAGTAAAAVWATTLVIAVILPLLLG